MPLRRLLVLSAAASASGSLRRSLSTAASRPSWAMINDVKMAAAREASPELRVSFHLAAPPRESKLVAPAQLLGTPRSPSGAETQVAQIIHGRIRGASDDGLLLVRLMDCETTSLIPPKLGEALENLDKSKLKIYWRVAHIVCNPLSGQVLRLPDLAGGARIKGPRADIDCSLSLHMGLLTQADLGGDGPPDRFAVADFGGEDCVMHRFLSETGRWDALKGFSFPFPASRGSTAIDQEVVAFAGRLWWADLSRGAVSVDPFSDKPDFRFVELPRGSVLSTDTVSAKERRDLKLGRYRRVGVSEGRLRYAEVSGAEPFMLSSFVLDDEGSRWTLERRVALSRVWADGGYPWMPLRGDKPRIGVIDPSNADVMYVTVGDHVVGVDMAKGKMIGSALLDELTNAFDYLTPCVLPPWLESSRIPSLGKINVKSETLATILVHSDRDKNR